MTLISATTLSVMKDISAIEKEMKKVAKSGKKIIRHEITKEEALGNVQG